MAVLAYLTGIIISLIIYSLWKLYEGTKYWTNRGIPGPRAVPIAGSFLPVLLQKVSMGNCITDIYKKYCNERFVGMFTFSQPTLLLTNLEDIENVLVADFTSFMDRGLPLNEKVNPHSINLFGLTGNRWRAVRAKVTPTFTTSRIREMVPEISECWKNVDKVIQKKNVPHEMKDVSSIFTMDVIASVAFGIDSSELGPDELEFREKTKEFFNFTFKRLLVFLTNLTYPDLAGFFKIPVIPRSITDFFAYKTIKMIEYRRENKVQRKDFLQLMMQLQEKGSIETTKWDIDDDYLLLDSKNIEPVEITENLIVSQAVTFFTAGYESTANTILFALFEIYREPMVMEKAIKEAESVISKHGKFTYEALKELTYLEQCIKESLRLNPVIHSLTRRCMKDYQFKNSDFVINTGVMVSIPIYGLHTDPKYWSEPMVFNPDRFAPGNTIIPSTYMPFGYGPRMCIAMRFALMEVKIGLAKLLLNYDIQMHPDTEIPIRSNIRGFLNSPSSPVKFFFKRKSSKLF